MIISIILNILTIILWVILGKKYFHYKQKNDEIDKQNRELQQEYVNFTKIRDEIEQEIAQNKKQLEQSNEYLQGIKDTAKEAFEHYCDNLERDYVEKETDYQDCIDKLEEVYAAAQQEQMDELEKIKKELEKIKNTRAAAIEALRKEKEIAAQKDFYSLKVSDQDLADVKVLERIKKELHSPRILSMLIWKTYFLTAANQMIIDILGATVVTGIYKITNQIDGCCYIGQSVNVRRALERTYQSGARN